MPDPTPRASSWTSQQVRAVRAQCDRLLASEVLRSSPRQQRLLRHIIEATLAGDADRLKGYTLGVEVYDRGADFDPAIDPIVRVEAGRLRGKLLAHYSSGDGANDPVLIDVPKGSYAARFVFGRAAAAAWPAVPLFAPRADRPRIAVLPFTNLSGDPQQEHIADGMTEDLTTDLSKLSGLFVVSRHSAFACKHSALRVEQIAAELGVRYVLEGGVRRAGDTLRITAQLIDADSGDHLWAERYDRPLRDLFEVQDEVARHIVHALSVKLTPLEDARIGPMSTASLEAHDCVHRGIASFWSYTPEGLGTAQAMFAHAVALDPEYAAAHAWLALAAINRHGASFDRTAASLQLARAHMGCALSLDPMLPLAHIAACHIEQWSGRTEAAIAAGRRAIALDPNHADAHAILAMTLTACNRPDEALPMIEIAMRLTPRPTGYFFSVKGLALRLMGRVDEAVAVYREGLEAYPAYVWSRLALARCYMRTGRMAEAREQVELFRATCPHGELVYRNFCADPQLRRQQSAMMRELGFVELP